MSTLASDRFLRSGYVTRSSSSGLADVLEVLLDKGLVLDVFVRVALVGIELLTIDARIVIASVDTYLSFAEAVNRLDLGESSSEGLPQLINEMTSDGAESKTKGALEGVKESLFGNSGGGSDEEEGDEGDEKDSGEEKDGGSARRSAQGSRSRSRTATRGR